MKQSNRRTEKWLVKKKQASKQALSDAVYWMEVGGDSDSQTETLQV